MSKSLHELLKSDLPRRLPLHMPGHKRNALLAPYLEGFGAALDVTEIEGFDNLHAPEGILKEGMERAARLYHAHRSFYLVNGSTGGILAGVRALSARGDKVLMQRASHLSAYQAVALCGLRPVYLYPGVDPEYGAPLSLRPESLEKALSDHPDTRLLVLTCPSYEGVLSDLEALVAIAHARGVRVLVDAAHGAHLGLSALFPKGAVRSGADIVIHSLHKTLPSLTQTALAHAADAETAGRLSEQLDVFQTSSPSYLLMASIDGCLRLMEERGEELFQAWQARLDAFRALAGNLSRFRVFGLEHLPQGVFELDPSKILIGCAGSGISGARLSETLRLCYGIDLEMAGPLSALAMTGMGDADEALPRLYRALSEIEKDLPGGKAEAALPLPEAEALLAPGEALTVPYELIPEDAAAGRICAEFITVYPPGAPLLVPGERISGEALAALRGAQLTRSRSKGQSDRIAVLKACD